MDQSDPLDLSIYKESKVDSKQQTDASKDSIENPLMKKETVPVSATTVPWSTGVLVSDFKNAFPGIFNFTVGILMQIKKIRSCAS